MWPWEASVKDSTTQGPLREMRPIFFATFPEAWPENCSVPTVSKHRSCACVAADATTPIATLPLSVAEPARSHPIWNLPPHARRPPARVAPRHKPRRTSRQLPQSSPARETCSSGNDKNQSGEIFCITTLIRMCFQGHFPISFEDVLIGTVTCNRQSDTILGGQFLQYFDQLSLGEVHSRRHSRNAIAKPALAPKTKNARVCATCECP